MLAAHGVVAVEAALQEIFQHGLRVQGHPAPVLRQAGLIRVQTQVDFADPQQRRSEFLRPEAAAAYLNPLPVQFAAVPVGKEHHVAKLADAEAAVEEVLKGVEDQVQKMIRVFQCAEGAALDFRCDRPQVGVLKEAVEAAVGLGFRGEEVLVELNVQGRALLAVGYLIGIGFAYLSRMLSFLRF